MKLFTAKIMGPDGQLDFRNVEAVDIRAAKRRMQEILPAGTTVESILDLDPEEVEGSVDETPRYPLSS